MTAHERYYESAGAYLLDALDEGERRDFDAHLGTCLVCRDEVERLRPAADALPRSVEPVPPPPGLKLALMEVVEREATVPEPVRRRPTSPGWLRRAMGAPAGMRPTLAWVSAVLLLVMGVAGGFAVSSVVSENGGTTVAANPDDARVPLASGRLKVFQGQDGAVVRLQGMPSLRGDRVYQAWVERDGEVAPQPTFEVGPGGTAEGAISDDLEDADAVLITREPRGGARAPSEKPIVRFKL